MFCETLDLGVLLGADPVGFVPRRANPVTAEARAVREGVGQSLGVVRHRGQRGLTESVQVHVDDLLADRPELRMLGVPLAPDAVGTDVDKLDLGIAVVPLSQSLDEPAVLLQVQRIAVIRLDPGDPGSARRDVGTAGDIVVGFAASVKKPLRRAVIASFFPK